MAAVQRLRATRATKKRRIRKSGAAGVLPPPGVFQNQNTSGGTNATIKKTDAVLNGTRLFFFPFVDTSSDLWLGGEIIRREIKQVATGVNNLTKYVDDEERS